MTFAKFGDFMREAEEKKYTHRSGIMDLPNVVVTRSVARCTVVAAKFQLLSQPTGYATVPVSFGSMSQYPHVTFGMYVCGQQNAYRICVFGVGTSSRWTLRSPIVQKQLPLNTDVTVVWKYDPDNVAAASLEVSYFTPIAHTRIRGDPLVTHFVQTTQRGTGTTWGGHSLIAGALDYNKPPVESRFVRLNGPQYPGHSTGCTTVPVLIPPTNVPDL